MYKPNLLIVNGGPVTMTQHGAMQGDFHQVEGAHLISGQNTASIINPNGSKCYCNIQIIKKEGGGWLQTETPHETPQ